MRNIRIAVQYDGTNYAGWQRQKTSPTIQQTLEEAVSKMTGKPKVVVHGSGRTDAGVHAVGQVANFQTEAAIPAGSIPAALNSHLPDDIVVTEAADVDATFHARKSARSKWYRYTIVRAPFQSPVGRQYALCVRRDLNLAAMREATAPLIGEHDFAAFESKSDETRNSVRTLTALTITEQGEQLLVDVRANGFLYNMVRAIVGTLLEVGRGKIRPEQIEAIRDSKDRSQGGYTAAAKGLCLMAVDYGAAPATGGSDQTAG